MIDGEKGKKGERRDGWRMGEWREGKISFSDKG